MIDHLLDHEGPIFTFLDKVGRMILLSVLWFVGCLPIVTIGTSTTALYYAVIKNIRRDHGTAFQEFWRSYRSNLKRGVPATVILLLIGYLLAVNFAYLTADGMDGSNFLLWGSVIIAFLCIGIFVYLWPVLSRFSMGLMNAVKLSFVMAIRFIPITIALAAGTVLICYLQMFVLPIPFILILPALWIWIVTYPMEHVLRKFMPPKQDEDEAWYYQ